MTTDTLAAKGAGIHGDRPQTSLWRDAWLRLRRNRAAVVSLAFIAVLCFVAAFADQLAPYSYTEQDLLHTTAEPSSLHWLGTDRLGRDTLSRLIYGTRVSLAVGLVAVALIVLIGVPIGVVSGYFGGKLDMLIMGIVDVLYCFPDLLFIIIVMSYIKAVLASATTGVFTQVLAVADAGTGGLLAVFLGLAITGWLTIARLVRGQILSLKRREFVEAARCLGARDSHIMARHLAPNALGPVMVAAALRVPGAIMGEASLSFLGLGVEPPTPSWGIMISEGIPLMRAHPYMLAAPALAISFTLLAFTFLGDGLRDAMDPLMKR